MLSFYEFKKLRQFNPWKRESQILKMFTRQVAKKGKEKEGNPDEWKQKWQKQQQEAPSSQRVEWLWRQVG